MSPVDDNANFEMFLEAHYGHIIFRCCKFL